MGNHNSTLNEFQDLLRAIRRDALNSQVDETVCMELEDSTFRTDASITEDLRLKSIAEVIKKDIVEEVTEILNDGGLSVNDTIGRLRITPLHLASYYGSVNTLQAFLALPEVQIDVKTADGDTPAMLGLYGAQNDEDALAILEPFVTVRRDTTLRSFAIPNKKFLFPLCVSIQKHFVKSSKFLTSKSMVTIYSTKELIYALKLALASNQESLADFIRSNLSPHQGTELLQEIKCITGLTAQLEELVEFLQRTFTGSEAENDCSTLKASSDSESEEESEQERTLMRAMPERHASVEDASGRLLTVGNIVKTLSVHRIKFVLPEDVSPEVAQRLAEQQAIVHEIMGDKIFIELVGRNIVTRLKAIATVYQSEGPKITLGDGTLGTVGAYVKLLRSDKELRKFTGSQGWLHGMEETCGKTGKIVRILRNADILVQFPWGQRFYYRAQALLQSSSDKLETYDQNKKTVMEDSLVQISKFRSDFETSQKSFNLPFDETYHELPWKFAVVKRILLRAFSESKTLNILCKKQNYLISLDSVRVIETAQDRNGVIFGLGDRVQLIDDKFAVKAAQKPEFGGWIDRMREFLGQVGKVIALVPDCEKSSGLMIKLEFAESNSFYFNPRSVVVYKEKKMDQAPPPPNPIHIQSDTVQKIDRQDLECFEILGEGAFGSVVRGHWSRGGAKKVVAIKQIKVGVTGDVSFKTLMAEANTQYSLQHPNIVSLFGISYIRDLWIIMDFVDGCDLFSMLHLKKNKQEFTDKTKIQLSLDMSNAIAYIHQKGYLHCDIKPHNMMVDRNTGKLFVCDFGITRYLGSMDIFSYATQYTNSVSGTLYYIPPECLHQDDQGRYKRPTPSADVWALGAVFYELFTNMHLYENHMRFLQDKMERKDRVVKTRVMDVPANVRSVVARSLDFNMKLRPAAQELSEFFHEINC